MWGGAINDFIGARSSLTDEGLQLTVREESAAQRQRLLERLADIEVTAPPVAPATLGAGLEVSVLGPLEVRISGARVGERAWRTSKAKELFVLLLMSRERAVGRDELIESLWPESDLTSAVANFHFTLHSLRKALASADGGNRVSVVRGERGYQLVTAARVPVDIELFRLLLREAQEVRRYARIDDAARLFRAAAVLYRGDFLADLENGWVQSQREELARAYLSALRQLAELELERKNAQAAVHACAQFLAREPYDEQVHRLLLRAYHEAGDEGLVVRHYQALAALLRRELNEEPQPATTQLYEKLHGRRLASSTTALPRLVR